jgi:hypothetical protein
MYVVAVYNLTNAPLQFLVGNVHVAQVQDAQSRSLKVYTYDELVSEERTRQAIQALGVGLAAAGNAMFAASAGNYNATANVYGPNGVSTVNIHGYDPTAAAIAQNRAATQNEAMISNAVETGQRNLVNLERTVIRMTRCCRENGTAANCNLSRQTAAHPRITTSPCRSARTRTRST